MVKTEAVKSVLGTTKLAKKNAQKLVDYFKYIEQMDLRVATFELKMHLGSSDSEDERP